MVAAAAIPAGPLRPPLKWAGGKRWLVPYIKPLWRGFADRRLVEPLAGGLAVAVSLLPQRALLNDINPHAINFYRWLQRGLTIDVEMRNDAALYYAQRARFNALSEAGQGESREAAELFYYLNRSGYNGLCRFNSRGQFNVPFGRYRAIRYCNDFRQYQGPLAGWEFASADFAQIALDDRDFVYADPPYDVEFTRYAKEDFAWDDQIRLAEWLARHGGPVVLSNQATERVVDLYTKLGFSLSFLDAPRRISCTGDRTSAREVLATRGI